MDTGLLSYAILIEIIMLLVAWIAFVHWRLSKKKKELIVANAIDIPEPFEVYLQYINRELAETKAHLDDLSENHADDLESINMYQYRLKHLDAEQMAMTESKGDAVRFWELYRSNIDFVYSDETEEELPTSEDNTDEGAAETPEIESIEEQLSNYKNSSQSIIEQSNNVIELVQKLADKGESEELTHMLGLLTSERDDLSRQLELMEKEYARLMNNAAVQSKPNIQLADSDTGDMSKTLVKQNARVSELNDIVGDLSLELEDKKRLVQETQWVTRQLKETEHVVVILEDENTFLRDQIKQLLEDLE